MGLAAHDIRARRDAYCISNDLDFTEKKALSCASEGRSANEENVTIEFFNGKFGDELFDGESSINSLTQKLVLFVGTGHNMKTIAAF
ncbi:MAG: hypothetical protein VYA84_19870 [Planctomycetota bacterium]|nr:hypothetical protein [Planctomycetota bacterium]